MGKRFQGVSGNQLKILAMALMTVDHIGMLLFPTALWMRMIGRAAFPIFAYMIAEGCRYTRSRPRYFWTLVIAAVPCQLAYAIAERSAYQCVLVTFACSVLWIHLWDRAVKNRRVADYLMLVSALVGVTLLYILGRIFGQTVHFDVDYGLVGIALPLIIFLGRTRWERLAMTALGLVLLSATYGGVQWWCLTALLPLGFYNGTRGVHRMKYVFYIYYPLHLAALYGISFLL